jgi:hypothetical protein
MDTLPGSPRVTSAAAVPTKARPCCAGSPPWVAPAAAVATVSRLRCAGSPPGVAPAAAVLMVVRSCCAGSPRRVAPAAAVQIVVRSCCAGSPRRVAPAATVLVEVRRCCAGSPRRVAPAAAVLMEVRRCCAGSPRRVAPAAAVHVEAWSRCGGSPPSVASRSIRACPEAVGSGDPGPVCNCGAASGQSPPGSRGLAWACPTNAAGAVARARQATACSHGRAGHTLEARRVGPAASTRAAPCRRLSRRPERRSSSPTSRKACQARTQRERR